MNLLALVFIGYCAWIALIVFVEWAGPHCRAVELRDERRQAIYEELRRRPRPRPCERGWLANALALIGQMQAADIVDNIVSVQPMTQGLARVHYMDVKRHGAKIGDGLQPRMSALIQTKMSELSRILSEEFEEQVFREVNEQTSASPRPLKSWSVTAVDEFLKDWGPDASMQLIAQGLKAIQDEEKRAVRNHLIARSAVEESFANWELRNHYRNEFTRLVSA